MASSMFIVIRAKSLALVPSRKFSTMFARFDASSFSKTTSHLTNKIHVKICCSVNDANLENMKHYGKNRWRSLLAITFGTLLIIISHLLAPFAHVSRSEGEKSRKTNFKSVSQVVEMENVYWGMREMPGLSRKSASDRMKNWNVPMPHLPPQGSTILSYITFWAYVLLNDHLQVITAYFCFWNILFIRLYLVFTNIRIEGGGAIFVPFKNSFLKWSTVCQH